MTCYGEEKRWDLVRDKEKHKGYASLSRRTISSSCSREEPSPGSETGLPPQPLTWSVLRSGFSATEPGARCLTPSMVRITGSFTHLLHWTWRRTSRKQCSQQGICSKRPTG